MPIDPLYSEFSSWGCVSLLKLLTSATPSRRAPASRRSASSILARQIPRQNSQILSDGPELSHCGRLTFRASDPKGRAKTMLDVIVNQCFLGIINGILDCLQLLGKLGAGPTLLDHSDDRLQMPLGPPEPPYDLGVILVLHGAVPVLKPLTAVSPEGG